MNGWITPLVSPIENTRLHCSVLYGNTIYILYGISSTLQCTEVLEGKGRAYSTSLIKYQISTYPIYYFTFSYQRSL
jgi:hypothetical protein